jgi:hypothetical protein
MRRCGPIKTAPTRASAMVVVMLEMRALAGNGFLVRSHRPVTSDATQRLGRAAKGVVDADARPTAGNAGISF